MTRTLYKARGMGSAPPCAICMGPGVGGRAPLHLPFGLSVWLCAEHRSPEFLQRRAGRDLVVSLSGVWRAAGCLTASRQRALRCPLSRMAAPSGGPPRPGSYSWPGLRAEAEERFARGEAPARVIRELRARHAPDPATAPSVRTMQRWFSEGRWLHDPDGPGTGRAGGSGPSRGPAAGGSPPPTVTGQGRPDTDREDQMTTYRTTRIPRRAEAGFTFVELLVAMIVLGLLALGLVAAIADRYADREIVGMVFILGMNVGHIAMLIALARDADAGGFLVAFALLMLAGDLVKLVFLATTLTGTTTMWMAILADTGATVIVTLTAMRLFLFKGAKASADGQDKEMPTRSLVAVEGN